MYDVYYKGKKYKKFTSANRPSKFQLVMRHFRKLQITYLTTSQLIKEIFTLKIYCKTIFCIGLTLSLKNESKYWRKHFNFKIMFAAGYGFAKIWTTEKYNSVMLKYVVINIEFSVPQYVFLRKTKPLLIWDYCISNRWNNYYMYKNYEYEHFPFLSLVFRYICISLKKNSHYVWFLQRSHKYWNKDIL